MNAGCIFTIGHSDHTFDAFLNLLRLHSINAIADVRSSPYSRLHPDFNREFFTHKLSAAAIAYVFLGCELGARSKDPRCYENGRIHYGRLAKSHLFQSGLQRILDGSASYRIALLCAEKEPLDCHRTILVSKGLASLGAVVSHIHVGGSLETHDSAMNRLLEKFGMSHANLYLSKEQLIDEACALQEKRIAYIDDNIAAEVTP